MHRQTLPVADTIVVRGVSPFHCALNAGAAQVRTPFFVQVDADMTFDDTCLEDVRKKRRELDSWLALVAMCHGVFHEQYKPEDADDAYASLAEILAEGSPW